MQCGLHVRRQPGPYVGEMHSGRIISSGILNQKTRAVSHACYATVQLSKWLYKWSKLNFDCLLFSMRDSVWSRHLVRSLRLGIQHHTLECNPGYDDNFRSYHHISPCNLHHTCSLNRLQSRVMTWHDMTWHDMTWHDITWHDMTCHDVLLSYLFIYLSAYLYILEC